MRRGSSSMNPKEPIKSTSLNAVDNYHVNDKFSDTHSDDRSIDDKSIDDHSIDDHSFADRSINDNKSIGDHSSKNSENDDISRSLGSSGSIADTTLTTVDGRHSKSKFNLLKPMKVFEIDYVGTGTYQVSQQNILQKRSIEPYKNSEALLSSRGTIYKYMYICICVCMFVYIYIYICVYVCIYVHVDLCVCL